MPRILIRQMLEQPLPERLVLPVEQGFHVEQRRARDLGQGVKGLAEDGFHPRRPA